MFKTAFVFIHSFLWSISFCINCPECGQTSRPGFGVKVQTQKTAKIIITICLTLCLIISLFSYTKIVLRLRQHQSSVRDNVQQRRTNAGGIPLNLDRYKRIVVSIALVQLALVICYFPFLIFHIVTHSKDIHRGHYLLWYFHTSTLIFLNSSLNPFLYCWRIKEIRQAVKATITGLCACLSRGTSTLSTNH